MEKLNQRLEREVVTNVFFVMGEFPSEPPPEAPDATVPVVDATRLPEGELGRIEDPELRNSLRQLLLNQLRKRG